KFPQTDKLIRGKGVIDENNAVRLQGSLDLPLIDKVRGHVDHVIRPSDLALEEDLLFVNPEKACDRIAPPFTTENREALRIHPHEKEYLCQDLGRNYRPLASSAVELDFRHG